MRAGKTNMFLSPLFRQTMSNVIDATIELYDTDGALGAARGAAIGAGLYSSPSDAFSQLKCLEQITPDKDQSKVLEIYEEWNNKLKF